MPDLETSPLSAWQQWRRHCAMVRSRRALLDLSPHQLRDVGLSEAEALREAWRPVWDVRAPVSPTSTMAAPASRRPGWLTRLLRLRTAPLVPAGPHR